MPERFQFVAVLALVSGVIVLLDHVLVTAKFPSVASRPRALFIALIAPLLVSWAELEIAVNRDLVWVSRRFTSHVVLPRAMPLEFVLVPVVLSVGAMVVFELATRVLASSSSASSSAASSPFEPSEPVSATRFAAVLVASCVAVLVVAELWRKRSAFSGETDALKGAVARLDWDVPELAAFAVFLPCCVVLLEHVRWHTGLFRMRAYQLAIGLVLAGCLVTDWWLTKRSAPLVTYAADERTGIELLGSVAIEDLAIQWAIGTLAIASWIRTVKVNAPGR